MYMRGCYEIKVMGHLGLGRSGARRFVILNREVSWRRDGVEVKADPRHAEKIVKDMGLAPGSKGDSPGTDVQEEGCGEKEMNSSDAKRHRGLAARANYVGLGRPDSQFCTKEACRSTSIAREKDWVLLKRIAKYLIHAPEVVIEYKSER